MITKTSEVKDLRWFLNKYRYQIQIGVLSGIVLGAAAYITWDNIVQRDWFLLTARGLKLIAVFVLVYVCYQFGKSVGRKEK